MNRFGTSGFSARSVAPTGRAANPRISAIPGGTSSPKGIRAAGDFINPFTSAYLPLAFWPTLINTFGVAVSYLPEGDLAQAVPVAVLWKDGASDEDVAPGRYSHIDVQNSDLPFPPAKGDFVQTDGKQYEVVRVSALAVGFSIVVLQEVGAAL